MNKRGSIQDVVFISVMVLVGAMAILIGFKVLTEFDTQAQSMDSIPDDAKTASTTLLSYYPGVLDNTFLLLTIVLCIGALILAAMVRVHPIFIPIFFIALTFIIFLSGVMSNIFTEMAESTSFATEAAQLTFISNIMGRLPFIIGVIGIVLMIVMYKSYAAAAEQ